MRLFLLLLSLFLVGNLAKIYSQEPIPDKAEDVSPLLYGETIPETKVKNLEGNYVSLKETIAARPTVLIFYRGGWCPYCNRQLSGLQEIESKLNDLGYQVVAISPDASENLKKTVEKLKLNYTLFSDARMEAAQALGIAYQLEEKVAARYREKSITLGGEKQNQLPVPTVMVLDQEGTIKFEYINPNYKERLNAQLLLYAAKLSLEGQ